MRDLRIGDKLKTSNKKIETVTKLESNILNKSIKVYNFEVEVMHNYFVSKDKVLVHNNCWVETGKRTGNAVWKKISKELVDKSTDVSSWSKGSFDSIQDFIARHFYKHGAEVRATSIE